MKKENKNLKIRMSFWFILGMVFMISMISCEKEDIDQVDRRYFHNGIVYVNETYGMRDTCRSFDICCINCADASEVEVMIEHQGQLIVYKTVYGTDTVHVEWYHPATMCRLNKTSVSNSEMKIMKLR